jgi:membrane protease YdiL (CAAX protease family)
VHVNPAATPRDGLPASADPVHPPRVEPTAEPSPPLAPTGTKSALAFFGVLLTLFPAALLAQYAHPVAGLAATQLVAFLLPALVTTAGSNLRLAQYLRLRPPRPALVALGALVGGAAYLVAGAVMTLTQRLLPRSWVEAYDLSRLFEGPRWEQAALALIAATLAPACEEISFRGYLQTTLAVRRGPAVAIGGGAFLFAVLHLDPVRFPALLVLGAVFGWITWRSGSVWPAVAAHVANNGIAATLLLALGRPEPAAPPPAAILFGLALGGGALGLLLLAFRAAAPAEPADATDALALRDPSSPSIRFDPRRVPRPLAAAALAGGAALVTLALIGLTRGLTRAP